MAGRQHPSKFTHDSLLTLICVSRDTRWPPHRSYSEGFPRTTHQYHCNCSGIMYCAKRTATLQWHRSSGCVTHQALPCRALLRCCPTSCCSSSSMEHGC